MSDITAVARLKAGDIGGLEFLVTKYQLEAVRLAYLITQDKDLAEDIVQSTFLHLAQRIELFEEARPFRPWLMRSVANASIQAARRANRHIAFEDEEPTTLEELLHDSASYPEEEAEKRELEQAIQMALLRLPPEQRAAIILKYYGGLSEHEMSKALAVAPGTVKWRLYSARKQLSVMLRQFWSGGLT